MVYAQDVIEIMRTAIGTPWGLQGTDLHKRIDCMTLGRVPLFMCGWVPRYPTTMQSAYGRNPKGNELLEQLLLEGDGVKWEEALPCDVLVMGGKQMKGAYHLAWVTESGENGWIRIIDCRPNHKVEEKYLPSHWRPFIKACVRLRGVAQRGTD